MIYKLLRASEWESLRAAGTFAGSPKDLEDGFIHFSTAEQAPETAACHFDGVSGLILAQVDETRLPAALKWEPSRGGALFPHLYAPLPLSAVAASWPLPLGADGRHEFPALGHPLDNPIFTSLTTRHARFAQGEGPARRFIPEVGPLAGFEGPFAGAVPAFEKIVRPGEAVGFFLKEAVDAPPGWTPGRKVGLLQMVLERPLKATGKPYLDLRDADAPEMLELAKITLPGPFSTRTHELGRFVGVREGGRLAAMAGERLKVPGFTEISAVCTHPEHLGKGHAASLISVVAERILARGETPFLGVVPENARAIALYERLGFKVRTRFVYVSLRRGP